MMTQFRKQLLAGIAALGMVAGAFAAEPGNPGGGHQTEGGPRASRDGGWSPEKMMERQARRQAELHDKLKLSPAQEPAWNTFAEKMKPGAWPARPDRAEMAKLPAPERMERMLTMMSEGEKRMTERLAAVKEFYAVLTPEQKKIFDQEFGPGRHHHRRHKS